MFDFGKAFQIFTANPVILISFLSGFVLIGLFLLFYWLRRKRYKNLNLNSQDQVLHGTTVTSGDKAKQTPPENKKADANAKQYPAMVFTDEGIKFKNIPEKLYSLIYCDPSMPKSGMKYMAVETVAEKDGIKTPSYKAFDPREIPVDKDDTPQRAWRSTHVYDLVKAVWAVPLGFLEKLNMIFFWVFCGFLGFLALIIVSRIGGH